MADTLEHRLDEALGSEGPVVPGDAFIARVRHRRNSRRARAVGGVGAVAIIVIVVAAAWPTRPVPEPTPFTDTPVAGVDRIAPDSLAALNALNRGDGPLVLPTRRVTEVSEPIRVGSWLGSRSPEAILDSL